MATQINGNHNHFGIGYAERGKKKRAAERAEKAKESVSGKLSELQVEYKKKWIRIVSVYSTIYTVITMLSSVLYLFNGIYEDPSGNWHELDRAMILLIGIVAFELCTNLPVKPLPIRYVIAYIPSQLLAFAYVWFTALREPLAKTAYRDIWINFTSLFVLLSIINTALYVYKKKRRKDNE